MNKADNLRNPASCLNKAAADEPLFILRAKDPVAAQTVRHWATMSDGNHEAKKIAQALEAADAMDAWRIRNQPPEPTAEAAPVEFVKCAWPGCANRADKFSSHCRSHGPAIPLAR